MGGMKKAAARIAAAFLLTVCAAAVAGCGGSAPPTDTGFNGTWAKETGSLEVAMYIWHDGRDYRFRMRRQSKDGTGKITCDWDGNCAEFLNDRKTSDLRFRLEESGTAGSLLLTCDGLVFYPDELEISYIHELKLSDDGLQLFSYTLESQGVRYEGKARGRRTLAKRSDTVPDPPSARTN